MKFIEKFVFLLGWLRIVFSPLVLGVIIGYLLYRKYDGTLGIVLGISIASAGLILGIIWAEHVRRKYGSMNYLGKINGSPELDKYGRNTGRKYLKK